MSSDSSYLIEPKPAPALNVPKGDIVTVRIIDSTSRIKFATKLVVDPQIAGHTSVNCPAFSFLITNARQNRHILFDLGVRKNWCEAFPPSLLEKLKTAPFHITVEKNVAEILEEDDSSVVGVKPKDIDTVIWSHHHWDHTGDLSTFPRSTVLAVGPGLPAEHMPGYPTNKDAPFPESDIAGRAVHEFDFSSAAAQEGKGKGKGGLQIGPFNAIDFFGDGSFYLLDSPGHTVGHICGLARTSTAPDTFIFMGGDASHHPGEFRASPYAPLPSHIDPSPIPGFSSGGCPGGMLQDIQRNKCADEAFYVPSKGFNVDEEAALATVEGLQVFDGHEHVLMVVAHDSSLLESLRFFPETMNDWFERGIGKQSHWKFLGDFGEAVKK